MAVLKQIKFGTGAATPIAKTVVQGKPEGVIAVTNTTGYNNNETEQKDYSYDIDVNVDDATIKKLNGKLAVGTVPAAQVSVDNTTTGIASTTAQAAFQELKEAIDEVGGAAKSYTIVKQTTGLDSKVREQYKLKQIIGKNETFVGDTIQIYKDSSLKSVELKGQALEFTYILADGTESTVPVDVSTFLAESEFKKGLEVNNEDGTVSVNVDTASESFLTVSEAGVKLSGVQNAINAAVEALDVTDTAEAGMYVSAVNETDGKVAITRANVSDAVLNGYAKGEKPASTEILATDKVKDAIAKLEHQVDAAKAAATTTVAKDASASHLTLGSETAADGSVTYTIGENDIASKTALDAEIAAREAADTTLTNNLAAEVTRAKAAEKEIADKVGLTGDEEARTFTPTTNYGGETATVMANMQAIDTKLKEVEGTLAGVQYDVEGTTLVFYGIEKKTAQA